MSRRYAQLSKAFERTLSKDGIEVTIARGNLAGTATAIFTDPRYSEASPEGATTVFTNAFFLMRRTDYHWTGSETVVAPLPGDVITNVGTNQKYRVIPRDDGRRVEDGPPEVNKMRIPVQPFK